MIKPLKDYATLARKARKAGLVKYDSRNLTTGQKAYLSRLENTHKQLLDHPEKYFSRNIGKEARKILNVKNSGSKSPEHTVINGKVFIAKQGYEKIRIKRRGDQLIIEKESKKKKVKTRIHKDPLYIFKQIDRFEKRLKKVGFDPKSGHMGPYEYVGAKFSDQKFLESFDNTVGLRAMLEEYLRKRGEGLLQYLSFYSLKEGEDDGE